MPIKLNGIDIIKAIRNDDLPNYIQDKLDAVEENEDAKYIILALDAAIFNTGIDIEIREAIRRRFIAEIEGYYNIDDEDEEYEQIKKRKMKKLKTTDNIDEMYTSDNENDNEMEEIETEDENYEEKEISREEYDKITANNINNEDVFLNYTQGTFIRRKKRGVS